MKKTYVSAMVLAALLSAQCYAGGVKAEKVAYDNIGVIASAGVLLPGEHVVDEENTPVDTDLSNVNYSGNGSTVYGVLATDNAILSSDDENISVSVSSDAGYATAVGADIVKNDSKYTDGGTVYLGKNGTTKNISINASASAEYTFSTGLSAIRNPSEEDAEHPAGPARIEVNGDNLIINVSHTSTSEYSGAAGVWVQNNTGNADNRSSVIINAENTLINVDAVKGTEAGLYVLSQGQVDVNSNLEIHASDVILTRGNSIININTNGQHSTKLYGNVDFAYDQKTSGTAIDSTVNMNLTGADSIWEGNIRASWSANSEEEKPSSPTSDVTGLHLTLADGAQWNATAMEEYTIIDGKGASGTQYEGADEVTLNGGIINLTGAKEQTGEEGTTIHTGLTIEKLTGTGGTVNLEAADDFSTRELEITAGGEKETALDVNFTGINADDIKNAETDMGKLAANVKINSDAKIKSTAHVGEGLLSGAISAQMNNGTNGNTVTVDSVQQAQSTSTMENMKNIAAVSIAAWRQEDSTFSQRLGDLRESKEGQGIWARMNRGEFEYSGAFKNQYNYFQIGYDMARGDWHYGAAVSYNDGETSYADGYGENSSTSLSLYGTRLLNDGQYLDLVLKVGRLSNEFDNYAEAGHTHGDYDAWGTEISGEYGKKLALTDGWFVTPQAQLSLMRIGSEDYTTSNGIHVDQDTLYSAVGRVGFEAGKDTGWGSFYAKASVLHEFAGDADTWLEMNGISNSYSQDIGDTWYEAGFGFNWKMSGSSYLYADVIRTFGGDIETPWQWNAGVRWGF